MPKPLSELFTLHGSDKDAPGGHSYGPVYDKLLTPRRGSLTAVLEVGVLGGSSIRAWRGWLPAWCRVVGIDNNLTCGAIAGAELYQADSRDPESVRAALGDSTFDVIVDDGGHGLWEQQPTWDALLPRLRPGGIYIVEDLQHADAREWFAQRDCVIHDFAARTDRFDDCLAVFVKGVEA